MGEGTQPCDPSFPHGGFSGIAIHFGSALPLTSRWVDKSPLIPCIMTSKHMLGLAEDLVYLSLFHSASSVSRKGFGVFLVLERAW